MFYSSNLWIRWYPARSSKADRPWDFYRENSNSKVRLRSSKFNWNWITKRSRDESTEDKRPVLFYKKLPSDIEKSYVILVDPMLATSGLWEVSFTSQSIMKSNFWFFNFRFCENGAQGPGRLWRQAGKHYVPQLDLRTRRTQGKFILSKP